MLNSAIKGPLVIGHRGASAVAPENTLAALRRAIDDGADGVEFDVRLSRDGVPVVIHDDRLRRTGLCQGVVAQMTAKELSQVGVGLWFNRARPGVARKEYELERVPTLDEVFQLFTRSCASFAKAQLYVEMKTDGASSGSDLARAVVRAVLSNKVEKRVVVLSFDLAALAEVKRLNSSVSTGALFKPRLPSPAVLKQSQKLISAAIRCGADEIALHRLLAMRATVGLAAERDLRVTVWTVNDPKWILRARTWGIHALITNSPAELTTVRA